MPVSAITSNKYLFDVLKSMLKHPHSLIFSFGSFFTNIIMHDQTWYMTRLETTLYGLETFIWTVLKLVQKAHHSLQTYYFQNNFHYFDIVKSISASVTGYKCACIIIKCSRFITDIIVNVYCECVWCVSDICVEVNQRIHLPYYVDTGVWYLPFLWASDWRASSNAEINNASI